MVILDANFEATEIHEASRDAILKALAVPGSKARNERHALGVSQFRKIATRRWPALSDLPVPNG